ncbi:MAG: GatB/YqeY domain-containing protein [Bacteroidota bacterium]
MGSTELRQILLKEMQTPAAQEQENRLRALQSVYSLVAREERKKAGRRRQGDLSSIKTARLLIKAVNAKGAAIKRYGSQGRTMVAQLESAELAIIDKYVPRQLTEDEVCQVIDQIIAQVAAQAEQDIPRVAKLARKTIGLGAEEKVILGLVKKRLKKSL